VLCVATFGIGLSPAAALVPSTGDDSDPQPAPPPQIGPGTPYISGRFAGAAPVVSPPAGAVIPDDFCLPGKLNDCGDHLRDQPATAAAAPPPGGESGTEGIVFFGDPENAFARARNSFWADGRFRQTRRTGIGESTDSAISGIGGDRRFGERFLLGIMVLQSESTLARSGPGTVDRGSGLLYGPYFAIELSDTWSLDGRLAIGTRDHTVTTGGVLSGQYRSRETYGALRLSGDIPRGNWRLNPAFEVTVLNRDDEAYIDGISGPVPAQSTQQTFLTGTLLGYYEGLSLAGGALTPYAGLEVSQLVGSGGPFGAVRVGLALNFDNGGMLNIDYAHGAIGLSGVSDRLLTVRLEIPF